MSKNRGGRGLSFSPNGFGVSRRNCLPGKVLLVCPAASLGQRSSVLTLTQDAHQRFTEPIFLVGRNQHHTCFGYGRRRFWPAIRNHRQPAGNSRNGTAPAA